MADLKLPGVRARSQPHPGARRAVGGVRLESGFHIHAGFGLGGRATADAVAADLWRWEGRWKKLSDEGPPPARYPSLCADGAGGFWRYGGCGASADGPTFLDDLWHWAEGWSPIEVTGERPDGRYTSALFRDGDGLMMFGGNRQDPETGNTYFGDLWRWADGQWKKLHGAECGPGERYGFGWVADGQAMYLFGGFDGRSNRGDLWKLDLSCRRWTLLSEEGPTARYCPALGLAGGALYLFGGRSKTDPKFNLADTWRYDSVWTELEIAGPEYHAKPAYASGEDALYIFGGEGARGHLSDTWMLNGDAWVCLDPASGDDPVLW